MCHQVSKGNFDRIKMILMISWRWVQLVYAHDLQSLFQSNQNLSKNNLKQIFFFYILNFKFNSLEIKSRLVDNWFYKVIALDYLTFKANQTCFLQSLNNYYLNYLWQKINQFCLNELIANQEFFYTWICFDR